MNKSGTVIPWPIVLLIVAGWSVAMFVAGIAVGTAGANRTWNDTVVRRGLATFANGEFHWKGDCSCCGQPTKGPTP